MSRGRGTIARAWSRYRKNPGAMIALGFLVLLGLVALFAEAIMPHDPNKQDLVNAFQKPSGDHWLGTDDLGRDMASRLISASRVSLRISFQVVGSALLFAIPIGLIAGYFGGKIDNFLMRIMDGLMSFPALILALAVAGILGPGITNAALALTVVFVPSFSRLMRGQTLAVRQETFVEASHSIGTPSRRIIVRHVLPNAISPVVVQTSLALGGALLAEAGLSFLGLGVQPPDASWGSMLRRSYDFIFTEAWMMLIPGLAIALTVLSFNTVGDGLRDALGIAGVSRRERKERRGLTTVVRGANGNGDATAAAAAASPTPTLPPPVLTEAIRERNAKRTDESIDASRPLLSVEGLEVSFQTPRGLLKVVEDVNFAIFPGETLGLVGESGSGKTVTSLSIMRLLPSPPARVTAGRVMLEGRDVLSLSFREVRELRGPTMAMIFQDPMTSLNPAFTIGNQIGEAVRWHEPINRKQATKRAAELLDLVGIPTTRLGAYPHELSGGMRQRAMIAIALACNPKLLICDEPTTALDVTIQAQILELMKSLRDELGMAMLFVTHDLGVVADICDRVAVMYAGQIVEQAEATALFHNPQHPYTEGLLKAMPQDTKPGEALYVIPGRVPSPGEHDIGCRFANRCAYAKVECGQQPIALGTADDEAHLSRCIRVHELTLGKAP